MHEETYQRLRSAVSCGDLFLVRELLKTLKTSRDIDSAELSECFMIAVQQKQTETAQFLLCCGADVMHTSTGVRAIHLAAQASSVSLLKMVIKAGSALSVVDDSGCVAMHYALKVNDEASVDLLLQEGAHLTRPKERSTGESPMHYAARYGGLAKIMRKLIAKGGDVNAVATVSKCTPLHLAVQKRRFAIVEVLCQAGALLDVKNADGDTPLLVGTTMSSHEMVRLLLNAGASPRVQNSKSLTPLHIICMNRSSTDARLNIAQLLVEYGADVEAVDVHGATAFHHAAMKGNTRMCECLSDMGASINAVDRLLGNSVLNTAISCNELNCALMLLQRGADISIPDSSLLTPLHKTQMMNKIQMAQTMDESKYLLTDELLKRHARVNATASNGFSPLDSCVYHLAVGEIAGKTLRRLVEAGAHLQRNMVETRTIMNSPLCWMTWHGSLKLARYLVNCGWDICSENWINMPGTDPETNALLSWMLCVASDPRPLKMLCRNSIREQMNFCADDTDISPLIQRLPVPSIIARYLALVDEYEV